MGLLDRLRGRAPRPTRQRQHHLSAQETRTPEEQERIDLVWEEAEPTSYAIECVEGCKTTVQALRALAESHLNAGDREGAQMLENFAAEFVAHEAKIL